jgi:hypothetical protein
VYKDEAMMEMGGKQEGGEKRLESRKRERKPRFTLSFLPADFYRGSRFHSFS